MIPTVHHQHVTIRALSKSFGGTVIYDKFDLDIQRGELISEFADIEKCASQVTSFLEKRPRSKNAQDGPARFHVPNGLTRMFRGENDGNALFTASVDRSGRASIERLHERRRHCCQ